MSNAPQVETESTYKVILNDGSAAMVKINGDTVTIDLKLYRENHSIESLTNAARAGRLPEWAKQVPGLLAKIDKIFADEVKHGKDPFEWLGFSDGQLRKTDLKTGVTVSGSVVAIKKQFEATGVLPRAFSSKRARQLLGLPLEGKAHV